MLTASTSRFAYRRLMNLVGTTLATLSTIIALIPLVALVLYVLTQGGSSLTWAFFTQLPAPAGETGGGMSNAIFGTLLLIVLASAIGLPLGLLSGIYLARSTDVRLSSAVRFVTDVIAGTPSIVAGVVAYTLVVIPMHSFSVLAGGVALGLLMFPTVTRATEEAIRLVPVAIREAGLALGLPEWRTMLSIILPTASSGIVTAIMLGIARVAGETAPLLFTILVSSTVQLSPLHPVAALPIQIWNYAMSPYPEWHRQAWAGAFVLFAIIVILNLVARFLTRHLAAQTGRT